MSESIFSAVLTFSLLAGGTAAVGSEMMKPHRAPAAPTAVATLPAVTVVGKRIAAADAVTLPTVVVTGRRGSVADVALDDGGRETRIHMSPDGHFWAKVTLNGVGRRMLIDSGATLTAISEETAREAGIDAQGGGMPILLRTANGTVAARRGTADQVQVGSVRTEKLRVVVSSVFGDVDVIGMNFLSRLASWRVEGRTLIMTPKNAT